MAKTRTTPSNADDTPRRRSARIQARQHQARQHQTLEDDDSLLIPIQEIREIAKIKKNVATIPELCGPSASVNCAARQERLFVPEETANLDNGTVVSYLAAVLSKLGVGNHEALTHLAQCQHDVKTAMESIDSADSMPLAKLYGPKGTGIWTANELEVFGNLLDEQEIADMDQIAEAIPTKTMANIVNAYYKLKKNRCDAKKGYFCQVKLNSPRTQLDTYVKSADCVNCRDKLWMSQPLKCPKLDKLCALCTLYLFNFGAMRPNATVTPEVFNFDPAKKCRCQQTTHACHTTLKQCVNKEFITIRGADVTNFVETMVGTTISDAVMNMALGTTPIENDHSYVFVCRSGLEALAGCTRLINEASTEDDQEKEAILCFDMTKTKLLKHLWSFNNINGNEMTLAAIQEMLAWSNIGLLNVPESIREEYEAGLPKGEPDCMLFGTLDAYGRLKQVADATFDEYVQRFRAPEEMDFE